MKLWQGKQAVMLAASPGGRAVADVLARGTRPVSETPPNSTGPAITASQPNIALRLCRRWDSVPRFASSIRDVLDTYGRACARNFEAQTGVAACQPPPSLL